MLRPKWLLILAGIIFGSNFIVYETVKNREIAADQAVPAVSSPVQVVLTRTYLCGIKDQESKQLTNETFDQVLNLFSGWEIVSVQQGKIELAKQENDISPECKKNGYFGITPEGMLTLFHGLPEQNKVIQTFYQINTARMEASLPQQELEQLRKGIKVNDVAEYNSILSTYGEFQENDVEVFGH